MKARAPLEVYVGQTTLFSNFVTKVGSVFIDGLS